jgi:hypothetical protein
MSQSGNWIHSVRNFIPESVFTTLLGDPLAPNGVYPTGVNIPEEWGLAELQILLGSSSSG